MANINILFEHCCAQKRFWCNTLRTKSVVRTTELESIIINIQAVENLRTKMHKNNKSKNPGIKCNKPNTNLYSVEQIFDQKVGES